MTCKSYLNDKTQTATRVHLGRVDRYTRATLNAISWVKMILKVKVNDLYFQLITAERIPRCIFGANLVILAQIHYKLSNGQAKFPRILCQNGHKDLEGHGQWPSFSIPTEIIPGCMFGANLVIPAQIWDELSCGQTEVDEQMDRWTDGWMDRRTDTDNDNTPLGW